MRSEPDPSPNASNAKSAVTRFPPPIPYSILSSIKIILSFRRRNDINSQSTHKTENIKMTTNKLLVLALVGLSAIESTTGFLVIGAAPCTDSRDAMFQCLSDSLASLAAEEAQAATECSNCLETSNLPYNCPGIDVDAPKHRALARWKHITIAPCAATVIIRWTRRSPSRHARVPWNKRRLASIRIALFASVLPILLVHARA
eukprot:scaffold5588_cov180-Amphora_coffeaeformis.AAC.4